MLLKDCASENIGFVHQYSSNGYHIILDVPSGSVHVADPLVCDAVAAFLAYLPENVPVTEESFRAASEKVKESLSARYSASEIEEAAEEIGEDRKSVV